MLLEMFSQLTYNDLLSNSVLWVLSTLRCVLRDRFRKNPLTTVEAHHTTNASASSGVLGANTAYTLRMAKSRTVVAMMRVAGMRLVIMMSSTTAGDTHCAPIRFHCAMGMARDSYCWLAWRLTNSYFAL